MIKLVAIKKQLVNGSVASLRSYGTGNPCKYITVHQTGNKDKGANAKAHANLQSKLNPRQASWHYQVDDKEVIQSFEDNFRCWHAHDGRGPGNTTSIAIEICINNDGDYKKAVQNAAELVRHLMGKYKLTIDKVKQHHDWYSKDCPAQLRSGYKGITWSDFIEMVKGKEVKIEAPKTQVGSVKVEAPKKPSQTDKKENSAAPAKNDKSYTGNSIVDYLNSVGVDSSQDNRKKLAKEYGVSNYDFSGEKNLELLEKMRNRKPSVSKLKTSTFSVGQKFKIKSSAKKYSRSTASIPSKYKNKAVTIQQVGNDDVLIKELYSWVKKADLQ